MRLLLYGSREFAETVSELARDCGHEVAGFIDDFTPGPGIIGTLEQAGRTHPPAGYAIAIAVGYSQLAARWNAWQRVLAAGYSAPALVHPRAYVARSAKVGAGTMVMAGALVDVRATIGDIGVIWPGACVSHDCAVRDNCFISPNATLCGFVELGAHSFVGAGAAVADHCSVPPSSRIKMLASYTGRTA